MALESRRHAPWLASYDYRAAASSPGVIMLLFRARTELREREALIAMSRPSLDALALEIELRVLSYGNIFFYSIDEPPIFCVTFRTMTSLDGLTS